MNSVQQQRESTHRELSFEWSHLQVLLDSSGFRSFLGLVKFAFGSERVKMLFHFRFVSEESNKGTIHCKSLRNAL